MEHVAAEHDARSAFAGLAVNGDDVAFVTVEKFVDVLAKGSDEFERRRIVIGERIVGRLTVELIWLVPTLGASGKTGNLSLGLQYKLDN